MNAIPTTIPDVLIIEPLQFVQENHGHTNSHSATKRHM
jgi:hypothetical protein